MDTDRNGGIDMGRLQADEMARLTDIDTALTWHLQSNHYPPIPLTMVKPCKFAIAAFNDEDYQREIPLPKDITYKGKRTAPACEIVRALHLESFIRTEDE